MLRLSRTRALRWSRWILANCLLAVPLYSQLDRGAITGTVVDPAGALVPGVQITIKNTATGAAYATVSNAAGQYTTPNLPIGPYQITFNAEGFRRLVRSGITLGIAEVLRIDVRLELGSLADAIEVTAEVPRLQTDTPEVGTSLSGKSLIDLPLTFAQGRRVESFAYVITPGVSGSTFSGHINGSTSFSKEVLVDGASVTTNQSGDFTQVSVSPEAIQEFRIQTSGLSAEFGRTQGGVFNFVLKSGTNRVHGSAYGGLRNEALNANDFVNNAGGAPRPLDRKQNYAFSLGGPVYLPKLYDGRNRTFLHATHERYRERSAGFGGPSKTAPLPEFYEGDFSRLLDRVTGFKDAAGRDVMRGAIYDPQSFHQLPNGNWIGDPFPGNRLPASRISKVSQRLNAIAKQRYLPTVRDASGQIPLTNNAVFPASTQPQVDNYMYSVKADHILNDRHKLSASYSFRFAPRLLLDAGGLWDVADPLGGPLAKAKWRDDTGRLVRLAHDWTLSPRLLNHFTASYNRRGNPSKAVQGQVDGAKELGIKGLSSKGYPVVDWGEGPSVLLESAGFMIWSFRADVSWGLMDTVSFSTGRHFIKAGLDLRRNHQNLSEAPEGKFNFRATSTAIPNQAFSGNYTGYSFASYLLGIVESGAWSDPVGLGSRRYYYGLFFQDDFKVSSKLTLNLGLRWEYQPPIFEVASRLSSWNPNKIDPVSGLPGAYDFAGKCQVCTGKRWFGTRDFRDFGPRFGFAWRPIEKWTVRGAYGILYEADAFNGYDSTPLGKKTSTAWGGTYTLTADPVYPWAGIFNWDNGFPGDRYEPASFNVSWGNTSQPGMIDPSYGKAPYIQSWNLNLQREITKRMVLDIGYVGNKGTRLKAGELRRLNQLPPSLLTEYGTRLTKAVRSPAEAAANNVRYPFDGFRGNVAGALRQYPQVPGTQTVVVYGAPLGFSTYHSFQVTLNREFSRGLTVYANYVWSKTLQNVDSSMNNDNKNRPLDYYNLKLEKAVSEYDLPHMFKSYAGFDLPVGRGRRVLGGAGRLANAVLGGWSVSAILNYYSGKPLGFIGSLPLAGGWNGAVNRANVQPGNMKAAGFDKSKFELSTPNSPNNMYLNRDVISNPPPLTLGNSARLYSQARNFGTINEDLGVQKTHWITEKVRFQMRAEFLDAFNRHQLSGLKTNVSRSDFGFVTTATGNRQIQVSARVDF